MKVSSLVTPLLGLGVVLGAGASPGCNCDDNAVSQFHRDLGPNDLSFPPGTDLTGFVFPEAGTNACGDSDPSCTVVSAGPSGNPSMPFPLPTDDPPPPNVQADGVTRDPTGALILDSTKANFDYLWVADDTNYGIGLISKISTKPRTAPAGAKNGLYNEVARYATVTCYSDNTQANWPNRANTSLGQNSPPACDGTVGCCDNAPPTKRTAVNLAQNHPSRTAVDFNGDVWVSNRAFGLQSSVTKIANKVDTDPTKSDCIDRNGNHQIDTSYDANGDGIIDTDCNEDNTPDDLINTDPAKGGTACAPVDAANPGGPKKKQEFFGLDDECLLFTTNTGAVDGWGRPLALGPGSNGDFGPSDAWAGRYQDGTFYRINGKSGYIISTVKLPRMADPLDPTKTCSTPADCAGNNGGPGGVASVSCVSNKCMVDSHPYGAVIDQDQILWAPNIDGHFLFYFDTKDPNNPAKQAVVGAPTSLGYTGDGFYGVAIDGFIDSTTGKLAQQVWMAQWGGGGGAFRYRPTRTANFADLATGNHWAFVSFPSLSTSGRGIAADNRTPANIWVGMDASPGGVGRIDDNVGDGASTSPDVFRPQMTASANHVGNVTLGVGVANDLDIWAVNNGDSSLTHYSVGASAQLTSTFKLDLMDNPRLADAQQPHPYTYSDFTGFGLRNFTNPHGSYVWTQTGCGNGAAGKTRWLKVVWDGETPNGTAIEVQVRSADDLVSLGTATFGAPYTLSPADLQAAPALTPNPSGYIDVQFNLTTSVKDTTPKLKGFQIIYECVNGVG